jgi:tetratricopeptide (TPR) repeat protein
MENFNILHSYSIPVNPPHERTPPEFYFSRLEDRVEKNTTPSAFQRTSSVQKLEPQPPAPQSIYALQSKLHTIFLQRRYAEIFYLIKSLPKDLMDDYFLTTRAYCEYNMGRTAAAMETLNEAIAYSAHGPEANKLRGDIYTELNRHEEALSDYKAARKLAPWETELIIKEAQELLALDRTVMFPRKSGRF